jgi:O-antigen/teichoic acid export membrane protein
MDKTGVKAEPLRRRTARGLLVTGGRGVLLGLVQVATIAILARILTPGEFGLFATVTALYGLPTVLVQQGVGDALVQRAELTAEDVGTAMTLLLVSALCLLMAMWLAAPWLAHALDLPDLVLPLRTISLLIPVAAISQILRSDARRRLQFERIAAVDIVGAVIGNSTVSIALALAGFGYWALICGVMAQELARMAGFGIGRWRLCRPSFASQSVKALFSFSALSSLWTALGHLFRTGERLVLPPYLGIEAVGFLSRARNVVSVFSEFFGMPVNQVLFPVLSRLQNERERVVRGYREVIAFSALLALPSAVVISALAAPLVAVFLGEQWDSIVPILRILAGNIVFAVITMPIVATVRSLGDQKEAVLLTAAQSAALLAGMFVLHPYGLVAIAVLIFAISAVSFVAWNMIVAAKLRISFGDAIAPMRGGAVVAACLAATWLAMEAGVALSTDTFRGAALFLLLAAVEVAALFFIVPEWLLGRELGWLHARVLQTLRRMISRRKA